MPLMCFFSSLTRKVYENREAKHGNNIMKIVPFQVAMGAFTKLSSFKHKSQEAVIIQTSFEVQHNKATNK